MYSQGTGHCRLPHFIMTYLTIYRHAGLRYQKGLTLILVNLCFTGMPLKAWKYSTRNKTISSANGIKNKDGRKTIETVIMQIMKKLE